MINLKNKVVVLSNNIHTIEYLGSNKYLLNGIALDFIKADDNSLLGSIHTLGFMLNILGTEPNEKNEADLTIDSRLEALGLKAMNTEAILEVYKFIEYSKE